MARYRGPKTKIARRFGDPIFGPDSAFDNRNYPPGQHGLARKRGKKSEYAVQLAEKQKAKYTYGILERQFRNLFEKPRGKKALLVKTFCSYAKRDWTMWFIAWE